MNKSLPVLLGLSLAASLTLYAQAQPAPAPPKVLHLEREFIKPGKAGAIHDRSESAFVQAMARAKWPVHYIALNSMSGKSRALYVVGYDSFADWQKDIDATSKNAALTAELERSSLNDGDLLTGYDEGVLYYQGDQSFRPVADLSHTRFVEITSFRLRPGHHKEWNDAIKLVIDAHKKANDSANWAMYELEYGGANEYLLFSSDTGLGDIDTGFAEGKKFNEALGEDGLKKLDQLAAAAIESSDSELFSINPKQSYAPDAWVKANPSFWKPAADAPAKPSPADKK